jgi:FKBP-type peptidyl-prolyl cis-trans isomerase SlpA
MAAQIKADSFVTLHYRLTASDGQQIVNTFDDSPATLQMGSGQLAPTLEECLIGMADGERRTIELGPEQAFGQRNNDLIHRVPRGELPPNASDAPGSQIDFTAPTGERFSGLVRDADETTVTVDFNHPLAGKQLSFEVQVIGVL